MRAYESITFDCYGTLIDWESGIALAFAQAAQAEGVTLDAGRVLRAYMEIEPEVEAGAYRSYRQVLNETARRVAALLRRSLSEREADFLAESLPAWPSFSDTNPALERLAARGYRLGILSNVDDDLLAATLSILRVPFDPIVTAQQVGSYKPAPGHFVEALKRIGNQRWLHAAQSYYHDIAPAAALGIPTAWINRKKEAAPGEARPAREFSTLAELADWLAS